MEKNFFQRSIRSFKENKLFYARIGLYLVILCLIGSILNILIKNYKDENKKKEKKNQNKKKDTTQKNEKEYIKKIKDFQKIENQLQKTEKDLEDTLKNIDYTITQLGLNHTELYDNIKGLILSFSPSAIFQTNYPDQSFMKIRLDSFKNIYNTLYKLKINFEKNQKENLIKNIKKEIEKYLINNKDKLNTVLKIKKTDGFWKKFFCQVINDNIFKFIQHNQNQLIENILSLLKDFSDLYFQEELGSNLIEITEKFFELLLIAPAFAIEKVTAEKLLNNTKYLYSEKIVQSGYPQVRTQINNIILEIVKTQHIILTENIKKIEKKIENQQNEIKKLNQNQSEQEKKKINEIKEYQQELQEAQKTLEKNIEESKKKGKEKLDQLKQQSARKKIQARMPPISDEVD